eukprot:913665-Amphidinium_carterae.1
MRAHQLAISGWLHPTCAIEQKHSNRNCFLVQPDIRSCGCEVQLIAACHTRLVVMERGEYTVAGMHTGCLPCSSWVSKIGKTALALRGEAMLYGSLQWKLQQGGAFISIGLTAHI